MVNIPPQDEKFPPIPNGNNQHHPQDDDIQFESQEMIGDHENHHDLNDDLSFEIPASGKEDSFDMSTDDVEIDNKISSVASAPARNIMILVILVIISVIFLWKFMFKDSEEVAAKKELKAQIEAQPTDTAKMPTQQEEKPNINIGVVETPELPAVENIQQMALPTLPDETRNDLPAPPPSPVIPNAPKIATPNKAQEQTQAKQDIDVKKEEQVQQQPVDNAVQPVVATPAPSGPPAPTEEQLYAKEMSRHKTGMLLMNGGGIPKEVAEGKLDSSSLQPSGTTPVAATKVTAPLNSMILQGKMIEAVLETTINTDLPGALRAVISRDVYAESGRNILIPSGSRLLGMYSSGITSGQSRVTVAWQRVIRPDGVDIRIESPGTDQLGRSGMSGIVDNKYYELFGNSLLTTVLTVGGAIALDKTQKAQTVTNSTTTGAAGTTTTQTSSTSDAAILQGVQDLSSVAKTIGKGLSTTPTIIVNQGARIRVFVAKDIVFPASAINARSSME